MITQEKPEVIKTEDRTPLNLLSIVALADPKSVFKSAEYKMLYDFIEKYFDYKLSIKELGKLIDISKGILTIPIKKEKGHGSKEKKRIE